VLLVDQDYKKKSLAMRALAILGTDAAPALPVLLSSAHAAGTPEALGVLVDAAPGEPAILPLLVRRTKDLPYPPSTLLLLSLLGPTATEARKQATALFVEAAKTAPDQGQLGAALPCLSLFGPDAKEALPFLKALKLHENESVRAQAKLAVAQFDAPASPGGAAGGPRSWVAAVQGEGTVAKDVTFRAGTPAVVWVTGERPAGLTLRVRDAFGAVVGESDGIPAVVWRPATAGAYRLEVTNTRFQPMRFRIKHN
jgi:hypothetical protein